jgi:hypothetical protein
MNINKKDYSNSDEVLLSQYTQPHRPYSVEELKDIRENLYQSLKLGQQSVYHDKCNHYYLVRQNSQKEKEILESGNNRNIGNCSVCWKLNNCTKQNSDIASSLVYHYTNDFHLDPAPLSYDTVDLENMYYKWLYY